jgi:hypothetical protein
MRNNISGIKVSELNGLVANIMEKIATHNPMEAVQLISSGNFNIVGLPPKLKEEKDVIYCSVVSSGITGEEWLEIFEEKNVKMEDFAEYLIREHFGKYVTSGITTNLVLLKGSLFRDDERTLKNVRIEAKRRGLVAPSVEVACLFREKISGTNLRDLNLYKTVIMHEPIREEEVSREGGGLFLFEAFNPYPGPKDPGELIIRDEFDGNIMSGQCVESSFAFAQPA